MCSVVRSRSGQPVVICNWIQIAHSFEVFLNTSLYTSSGCIVPNKHIKKVLFRLAYFIRKPFVLHEGKMKKATVRRNIPRKIASIPIFSRATFYIFKRTP